MLPKDAAVDVPSQPPVSTIEFAIALQGIVEHATELERKIRQPVLHVHSVDEPRDGMSVTAGEQGGLQAAISGVIDGQSVAATLESFTQGNVLCASPLQVQR